MMESSTTHLSGDLEEPRERRLALLPPLAARPLCSRIDALAAASAPGLSDRQLFNLVRRLRASGGDPVALQARRSNGGRARPRLNRLTGQVLRETLVGADPHTGTRQIVALIEDRCRVQRRPTPSISTIRRRLRSDKANAQDFGIRRSQRQAIASLAAGNRQTRPKATPTESDAALLGLLYDIVVNPAGWQALPHAVTRDLYFNQAALSLHDAALPCGEIGAQVNINVATFEAYARHYAAANPWLARPAERPLGVILTAGHAVPHADLLKTEYCHDFCRPQDIDLAIGLAFLEDGTLGQICLQRADGPAATAVTG